MGDAPAVVPASFLTRLRAAELVCQKIAAIIDAGGLESYHYAALVVPVVEWRKTVGRVTKGRNK